ncbi:MAG: c-type cytochrome biogenesis protein CcsB [bacterium]
MNSATLLSGVSLIYLGAWFGYVICAASRSTWVGRIATSLMAAAWVLNGVGFVHRWLESHDLGHGRIPLTNQYESMIVFAWAIALIYLIIELRYKNRTIGAFVAPLPFLSLGLGSLLFDTNIRPLVPALQSNWLTAHVITCFLGYAAFAVSFGVSVLYILRGRLNPRGIAAGLIPSEEILDHLNYRAIAVGFPFLSIGIITGAIWADVAWGTYWSWDPKETWSLITWLVYAAFLHARLSRGWSGKRTAILSMAGFGATLFTYFGVNFLLSGLHSYA